MPGRHWLTTFSVATELGATQAADDNRRMTTVHPANLRSIYRAGAYSVAHIVLEGSAR
jgi:hypothetical protein